MPIRMVPDEGNDQGSRKPIRRRSSGPGMSGGGGSSMIPMLLGFIFKKPKLLIILLLVFGAWYYFSGGCNPTEGGGGGGLMDVVSNLTRGANFDPAQYDNVEVFEPLADNVKNPMPERITLQEFAPPRLNQGSQGSCVGWASAYGARSILQAKAMGIDPKSSAFSPSYLYNQIKLNSQCQGAYINQAMETMLKGGVAPFSQFGYDQSTCQTRPNDDVVRNAQNYRIKGYQRLTKGDTREDAVDMLAVKQNLAQGAPVVIGMMVGGTFMQEMQGQEVWRPTQRDAQMAGYGGHAMCVIGYDDYKDGGAFQIMNSWGPEWGQNGIAWVPYDAFNYFTKEAYGLYPMGEGLDKKPQRFDVRFGLVDNSNGNNIALQNQGGRVFRTTTPIAKGSKFKIEVTNNTECYTYLFGEETDGSTYTLFPYTPKHSPYCGITGTRLFPSDHSLQADDIGERDVMAILVTNQPFDYPKINENMNKYSEVGLANKLAAVLGNELVGNVNFSSGSTIGASVDAQGANAVAFILEIDKR